MSSGAKEFESGVLWVGIGVWLLCDWDLGEEEREEREQGK